MPFPEKLSEGYQVEENRILANIGVDKLRAVLEDFILMHSEPLFFILELPTNAFEEELDKNGEIKQFHKDVYYIDGCSRENAADLLDQVGEMLIQDGMAEFGFGGHESGDEIMICKYNLVILFGKEIGKYHDFLKKRGIPQTEELITAWDTFSQEAPGSCQMYSIDGRDVYDIPELYKTWGMYLAERRPCE